MRYHLKINLIVFLSLLFLITILLAQNSQVTWYSFNMGFVTSACSTTTVQSVVGQPFVGALKGTDSKIESGFLVRNVAPSAHIVEENAEIPPEILLPGNYELTQNFPNPFNPETTIQYQLTKTTDVKIEIFNIQGQLIQTLVDTKQDAGTYSVTWDGRNNRTQPVASGIYIYRLTTKEFIKTRKLSLLK